VFMPWKLLLKMGRIKPSIEAIDMFMSSGEQMISRVKFKLKVKTDLQASTYLFTTYGGTDTVNSTAIYYIDTFVKVKGATTGTSITVPIRIIKNQN